MDTDLIKVLVLLGIAVLLFMRGAPRSDAVALMMLVALPFTGVITVGEALAGFSNANIVLIAAMFVIGEGLARTGVAQNLGDWLIRRGGSSETRLLVLLMLLVGGLGSVMYSSGVVAIFIPIALRIAQRTGIAPAELLMPVSYAALSSGMLTLVAAAPNLIINYELTRKGAEGLSFFSLTPIGLPILLLGILYVVTTRSRRRTDKVQAGAGQPTLADWVETYGLAQRELRMRVSAGSPLVGQTLSTLDPGLASAVEIVAVERRGRLRTQVMRPGPDIEFTAGDVLLIDIPSQVVDAVELCKRFVLEQLPLSGSYFTDRSQEVGMAEAVLAPDSDLVGKRLRAADLRRRFDLIAVGVRHGRTALDAQALDSHKLKAGDTLLLLGPWDAIRRLQSDGHDLVVLNVPRELKDVLPAAGKAPFAILSLGVTVALMVSGWVQPVQAALIGCLLMGLFKCIDLDSAYRAIALRSLLTIVGMLPFAIALERTGGVALAAHGLIVLVGDAGPLVVLATLYAITVLLGLFIVSAANAVLIGPVAMAMATELGASPYPFAITVALAASSAFMTPIAPANAMVSTPGNYGFADFARKGLPMVLIAMTVTLILVPWLYPLY